MTTPDENVPRSTDPTAIARRQQAATALRLAGASYDEIAQHLGYSSAADAASAVERDLRDNLPAEGRDQVRDVDGRRIERLLRSVWTKANDPTHVEHLPAVRTALALIDRHARLYGLDAPQEVIVYNPSASEIEAWVSQMTMTLSTVEGVIEADIIGDDIIEADFIEMAENDA